MERLRRLAARIRTHLSELAYERRFGLDTTAEAFPDQTAPDGDQLPYSAASWRLLQRWLRRDEVGPDDVFVDVGCGKGRVVFQAARLYPFKRVMGVDLSPDLIEIAERNIAHNRERLRCGDVELVATDATKWEVPDDVTVVFLYNPFRSEVFAGFLRQLLASVDRRPRDVRIVYAFPLEAEALERTGRVELLRSSEDAGDSLLARIKRQLSSDDIVGLRVYRLRARSSEGLTTPSASSPAA